MLRPLILMTIAAGLLLTACGNAAQQDGSSADKADSTGMGQFASDESFKAAHETPAERAFAGKGDMIQFPTPDGKQGSAYALMPEGETDKYLLVIHEWWGLNDHIKAEAERLFGALDNVAVLALDLYDGQSTANPDEAGKIMQSIKEERARAIIQGALNKIGKDAHIGTVGWCFGGGWSLNASIMAGERGSACVMYYGMPVKTAKDIAPLKAPILAIFAEQDKWITPAVAQDFENLAKASGKSIQTESFDAGHAFANPSNPNFNNEAAQRANQDALAFLRENL